MSNYGTPPFPPYDYPQPENSTYQAPPQDFTENTGEFVIVQNFPPWTQAGSSSRFYATFSHVKDGAIQPTGVTITILDGNGIAWAGASGAAITAGTVTQDPSNTNKYFSVVQVGASVPAGDYVVQWTGTYTPLAAGSVSENIRSRQAVKVQVTQAPSQYYLLDTSKA